MDRTESWINRTWRPMAAIVYLAICIFDFIIAPAWSGMHTATAIQLATAVRGLDPSVAAVLVQAREPWNPLTLQGSGFFHVAFGAILGVAAWTRGAAQIEQVKQDGESNRSPYTPTMVPTYYLPGTQGQVPASMGQAAAPVNQVNVTVPNGNGDGNQTDDTNKPDNPDA